MQIGLQLYTVRSEIEKDFFGTLKKVSEIGYKGLEFAGYFGVNAEELKEVIDDLGMKAINSHVDFERLVENLDAEIKYAKALGMKTITLAWLSEEHRKDRDATLKTSEMIARLDQDCFNQGMELCYHNHDFDFNKINSEYALDVFLRKAKNLKLELDTFWTSFAGIDTLSYMKKYPTKMRYIHLKDMIKAIVPIFTEIGEGCLDIRSFTKTAVELGVEWAFVEQDVCQRPCLESIKVSFDNMENIIRELSATP